MKQLSCVDQTHNISVDVPKNPHEFITVSLYKIFSKLTVSLICVNYSKRYIAVKIVVIAAKIESCYHLM